MGPRSAGANGDLFIQSTRGITYFTSQQCKSAKARASHHQQQQQKEKYIYLGAWGVQTVFHSHHKIQQVLLQLQTVDVLIGIHGACCLDGVSLPRQIKQSS